MEDMRYPYYYLDLNREDCIELYNTLANEDIETNNWFVQQKIQEVYDKFNKDKKILTIGLPLKNQSTKDILTILEENNIHFTITTHHN